MTDGAANCEQTNTAAETLLKMLLARKHVKNASGKKTRIFKEIIYKKSINMLQTRDAFNYVIMTHKS